MNLDPSAATAAPELTKGYDPKSVEARWYAFWEQEGVFKPSLDPNDKRPTYVCPMPPPNVTGSLHMGHAQRCTLQDTLVRYHRMRGYNTLWQPGIDHAGIATQTVVERLLAREGKTRFDLGREAFEARVWEWKNQSGGRIALQQRLLGSSPDWTRSKFTMDPDMNVAVREAFVRLHEQGLIYRATRLINWDPTLLTSLSDLEVDHEETNGELFEFAYRVDGMDAEIVVATTRPETMLGDTAVAVHPDDARYTHLHGKMLIHPFCDRKVPIVTDAILVDPKFGTGAVKVTPAHDFNDFATGKRHNLEEISIFNLDGTVNENGGDKFKGLTRERARTAVKKALGELGLAKGAKPHRLMVPRSQRSGVVIEPMISTQWFLKMDKMAKDALEVVRSGETRIIPSEWQKTYEHFLENSQDWCVSRQLWWGHQIPAWHGPNGEVRVARERPAECGADWVQDPDVLDTWFSSALWPFATQGWPEKTPELERFYPAADLETGYDILFFWVARMIMFGVHFTGKTPFKRVLLSGLIVDENGDKMSKVKGNVIDPLDLVHGASFQEMVEKAMPGADPNEALTKFKKSYPSAAAMGEGFPAFGADALRFTLATYPPSNKRMALAPKRIEGYRHFMNKVWNATRLSLELANESLGAPAESAVAIPEAPPTSPSKLINQWILHRYHETVEVTRSGLDEFRIDEATSAIYRFFWNDFCDWYLELAKTILRAKEGQSVGGEIEETRTTLLYVLESSLRLLHPIAPFITEELWQRLARPTLCQGVALRSSIAFGPYPDASLLVSYKNATALEAMTELQHVVSAIRTIRAEHQVHPASIVEVRLQSQNQGALGRLEARVGFVRHLAKANLAVLKNEADRPRSASSTVVPSEAGAIEVLVDLKGHVTKEDELLRIERETKRAQKDLDAIEKKMSSKAFVERAPKEVVVEAEAQKKSLLLALASLESARVRASDL
jgi:valyl-tRNA synthetase